MAATALHYGRALLGLLAVLAAPAGAITAPVWLGPPDPGAEQGADGWYWGTNGAGWTAVDDRDPATGLGDFTLGNRVAGRANHANWRCRVFPLGPAARGAEPITFSFAFKFPEKINGRENLPVYLRFYDANTNFLGQRIFRVGFNTGSSMMTNYVTRTFSGLRSPPRAGLADVLVEANMAAPWTSGIGRFDDFSVTTIPRTAPTWLAMAVVLGLVAVTIGFLVIKAARPRSGRTS